MTTAEKVNIPIVQFNDIRIMPRPKTWITNIDSPGALKRTINTHVCHRCRPNPNTTPLARMSQPRRLVDAKGKQINRATFAIKYRFSSSSRRLRLTARFLDLVYIPKYRSQKVIKLINLQPRVAIFARRFSLSGIAECRGAGGGSSSCCCD